MNINAIKQAGLGEYFLASLLAIFVSGFILLGIAIIQPHNVDCYYLETYSYNGVTIHKIMADVDWQTDTAAYKSIDPQATLDVHSTLKQCAKP